jgi:hypothetical protein
MYRTYLDLFIFWEFSLWFVSLAVGNSVSGPPCLETSFASGSEPFLIGFSRAKTIPVSVLNQNA